jgi:hypothetical protein
MSTTAFVGWWSCSVRSISLSALLRPGDPLATTVLATAATAAAPTASAMIVPRLSFLAFHHGL